MGKRLVLIALTCLGGGCATPATLRRVQAEARLEAIQDANEIVTLSNVPWGEKIRLLDAMQDLACIRVVLRGGSCEDAVSR